MAKRRCKGKTKAGKRCEHRGSEWCAQHLDQSPGGQRVAARADTTRTPEKRARATKRGREDWRPRFLAAFEEHVTVRDACVAAGVGHSEAYDERQRNPAFAEAWAEVEERTTQRMEREAFRRAVEGWVEREEFEIDKETGERIPTLTVTKFDSTLMIFLLKARRPETYRERIEHSGPGGGPVEHRVKLNLKGLTDEQLAALEAIQPDDGTAGTDEG